MSDSGGRVGRRGSSPRGVVLDAGGLIAYERGDRRVRELVALAERGDVAMSTSSGVVAQVWRGGARQVRLARLLASGVVDELPLGREAGRRIGLLAAATGATDVVDGHVAVLVGELGAAVLTSDPDDLVRWGVPSASILRC